MKLQLLMHQIGSKCAKKNNEFIIVLNLGNLIQAYNFELKRFWEYCNLKYLCSKLEKINDIKIILMKSCYTNVCIHKCPVYQFKIKEIMQTKIKIYLNLLSNSILKNIYSLY